MRLTKAADLYARAAGASLNPPELASALKNQGLALRDLCDVLAVRRLDGQDIAQFAHAAAAALEALRGAASLGVRLARPRQWCDTVDTSLARVHATIARVFVPDIERCNEETAAENADKNDGGNSGGDVRFCYGDTAALRAALVMLEKPGGVSYGGDGVAAAAAADVAAHVEIALGALAIDESIGLLCIGEASEGEDFQDYARALSLAADCEQSFSRAAERLRRAARAAAEGVDALDGLMVLALEEAQYGVEDAVRQRQRCESVQKRSMADAELKKHVTSAMQPNVDFLWTIADMYKEAVLLTRGQDIEDEAHALARLSVLYADVMCLREKAMLCSEKAMELGESLAPRDLTSVGWFNDALRVFDKCKRLGTAGTADALSNEEKAAIKTDLKVCMYAINSLLTPFGVRAQRAVRCLLRKAFPEYIMPLTSR
eukprot:TRINITY_DN536_c0_g1_i4.p1 TRINITY_DN536_c0_g1~~TRINITY_DN536_c0_g1_i4.p1  ORF type:complete len:431 (+),score=163.10 TRINITY_DN536_c0_g1_i4:717-2009(+)